VAELLDGREAAAIEDLELLEEMEFVAWLEYEAELGNGTDGAG
jgi:Ser/Thr protein kinase RdoA (MazF antagonist)